MISKKVSIRLWDEEEVACHGTLGPGCDSFIFDQECLGKYERASVTEMAEDLDTFFQEIPQNSRYHL